MKSRQSLPVGVTLFLGDDVVGGLCDHELSGWGCRRDRQGDPLGLGGDLGVDDGPVEECRVVGRPVLGEGDREVRIGPIQERR